VTARQKFEFTQLSEVMLPERVVSVDDHEDPSKVALSPSESAPMQKCVVGQETNIRELPWSFENGIDPAGDQVDPL
jgi:hypothetical protein